VTDSPVARHDEETIGYAFSLDGYNFTKSVHNPVRLRRSCMRIPMEFARFEPALGRVCIEAV
jgi:hypothetical protein